MSRPSFIRPSLNMQTLFADNNSAQDDNWMISYIDVFVLMTTIFVMLLVLNKSEMGIAPQGTESLMENTSQEIEQASELEGVIFVAKDLLENDQQNTSWLATMASSIELYGLGEHVELAGDANFTELQIQSRVLFDSGDSELTRAGIAVLEKLLPMLVESEGLIFIEGHTDDRPIETQRFRSNWDLASARATEVLQFFVSEGLQGNRLRAVSYGDTKPLVANDSDHNRRKNRRVSLMVQRQGF